MLSKPKVIMARVFKDEVGRNEVRRRPARLEIMGVMDTRGMLCAHLIMGL